VLAVIYCSSMTANAAVESPHAWVAPSPGAPSQNPVAPTAKRLDPAATNARSPNLAAANARSSDPAGATTALISLLHSATAICYARRGH
jgi:hypothetical protein